MLILGTHMQKRSCIHLNYTILTWLIRLIVIQGTMHQRRCKGGYIAPESSSMLQKLAAYVILGINCEGRKEVLSIQVG